MHKGKLCAYLELLQARKPYMHKHNVFSRIKKAT